MMEAEQPSMQTQAMQGIVAVAVLRVTTNGVPHISRVHTYLVLTACLELELHQRVLRRAGHHVEMCHCILAAVIGGRRLGHVGLVVLQPVGDGAFILLHLTRADCHIAAVVDNLMPVVLKYLFRLDILRIDH